MSLTDGALTLEYRVVWRWRTGRDEFSEERRREYKTKRGARLRMETLTKNGGHYTHYTDHPPTRYDDGFSKEEWQLDYAYVETRTVSFWRRTAP